VNRDEDVAFLDLAFITPGFEFRNTQADKSARNAADGCSDGNTA